MIFTVLVVSSVKIETLKIKDRVNGVAPGDIILYIAWHLDCSSLVSRVSHVVVYLPTDNTSLVSRGSHFVIYIATCG